MPECKVGGALEVGSHTMPPDLSLITEHLLMFS